ncbi:TIGR01777 family oxidoreductase [Flavobacterium sp.]|uniref:TIGR01777 family oxidoreductase n=1 Tax=Flavobacterium sp. TaxID=239 RepID=UPI0035278492
MIVLVTGATGLIGNELVNVLVKRGCVVHYLSTSKSKIKDTTNVKGFYWNTTTQEIDARAFLGVTTIFHLAGASIAKRWTKTYKNEIIASRVAPTKLLFQFLSQHNHTVTHFISASAIGIYPNNFEKVYNEDENEVDASFLGNVVTKWEAEADTIKKLGILVSKIRIGLVLAKKGGALVEMIKPFKLGFGAPLGNGKQWQSWIHIHDLAALFYFVFERKLEGIYNAVAPNPVTNEKLTKSIAKQLNKPLFLPNVPKFVLQLLLGEMSYLLVSSQKVSSQKIQQQGFQFQFTEIKEALKKLI